LHSNKPTDGVRSRKEPKIIIAIVVAIFICIYGSSAPGGNVSKYEKFDINKLNEIKKQLDLSFESKPPEQTKRKSSSELEKEKTDLENEKTDLEYERDQLEQKQKDLEEKKNTLGQEQKELEENIEKLLKAKNQFGQIGIR
jgi:peptidoglycan hydrolase CwlO-like protein